jgi:choline kinase
MAEMFDALILAAGIGARIKSSDNNLPKCLLKLDDEQTILSRQIKQLIEAGNVDRIIISSGFEHDQIEAYVESNFSGMLNSKILLEYNPFYSISNNLVSLWNLRGLVVDSGKGIMISNGDNVYGQVFRELVPNLPPDNLVVIRKKPNFDGDDMKVLIKENTIQQINKNISSNEAHGEAIGLSKFNTDGKIQLFKMLDQMVKNPRHLSSFYLRAFEYLIEHEDLVLKAHDCGNMFFEEIDFPEDYQRVKRLLPD